jgi:two-component system cell cycle sensor histidine kinase/response regulator CckA
MHARASGDRRLLLVEDDGELRHSLSELLETDGYEVIAASNGSEALDYLKTSPAPDLILLDLMMPVKDGWQFRIEQKRDPSISSIPVVALSADDTPKAAAIDAAAYLKKPFQYSALLDAIRRIIENRRLMHLDRMASLGTLAAGIAHEINNPLTYVIANLQLLEEEMPRLLRDYVGSAEQPANPLPSSVQRFGELSARLHDALEGAERIRGIVLHVKTFSRAGDEHRTYVDVRSILDSSIKVVFSEIRQRARLIKEYGHTPLVLANPGQLGQVFLNLLLNAAHAIEGEDPQRNTIRVTTRTSNNGQVVVEISDTGRGIPPEVQPRIFDPFFTTKPVGVGSGLGLSICYGIISSLRGTISVDSEIGRGTTLRIQLPASESGTISTLRMAGEAPKPRGKILIVDDEPRLARAVKDMIGPDYDTQIVATGTEALQLLAGDAADQTFDVILCDLHMPEMSGMDLHAKLETLKPHVAEQMVFMTGGTFSERSREFVSRVTNACIDKPIDLSRLRALLAAAMLRRESIGPA